MLRVEDMTHYRVRDLQLRPAHSLEHCLEALRKERLFRRSDNAKLGLCGKASVEFWEIQKNQSGQGSAKLSRILKGSLKALEVGQRGWRVSNPERRALHLEGTLEPTYQRGPRVRSTNYNIRADLKLGVRQPDRGSLTAKGEPGSAVFCCSTCAKELVLCNSKLKIDLEGSLQKWR